VAAQDARGTTLGRAARALDVAIEGRYSATLSEADLVICAVQGEHALEAAEAAAPFLKKGVTKAVANVNEILAEPTMKQRLTDLGGVPIVATPDAFGKIIADETAKWEKVVTFAGIKVE